MNPCAKCCMDMDIEPLDLLFPSRLEPEGREFVDAHGILKVPLNELMDHAVLLDNGRVKVLHRCDQLTPEGLCGIYEDRPKICRDYQCESNPACIKAEILELRRGA